MHDICRLGLALVVRRAAIVASLLVVPGATVGARAAPVNGGRPPACGPAHDVTLAMRGSIRIFADHSRQYLEGTRGFVLACDNATMVTRILTSVAASGSYLLPGSESIRGHLVAYGADLAGGSPDEPIDTFVEVTDLATLGNARGYLAPAVPRQANPLANNLGKVVSTVIGADGSVAWVSCEGPGSIGADLAIGRRTVCQRAGRTAWVYTARAPAPGALAAITPMLLDSGRGIEPRSLELTGATISWINSGKRHTARLA